MLPDSACGLQPGGEVHLAADDRVVHPVLAAEVADGAIARVDADSKLEGLFQAGLAPFRLQLPHPPLHGDRHVDAGERILLYAPRLRIAEEGQDRVADIFVDGRAMLERDLRHLGEIVVEEAVSSSDSRSSVVAVKSAMSEKKIGQLLAARGELDAALAG